VLDILVELWDGIVNPKRAKSKTPDDFFADQQQEAYDYHDSI
jgi:hypothetical protein